VARYSKIKQLGYSILLFVICGISFGFMTEDCITTKGIRICISEVNEKRDNQVYFIIKYENISSAKEMDQIFYSNTIALQYLAKDSISLIENDLDTIKPMSYIFEDNFNGTLPYYKQIVGFKKRKNYTKIHSKLIRIRLFGIDLDYTLKN
jgi:hypothetical protein